MAEIKDCIGKKVKISKGSITIKDDKGKTCGVVQNIWKIKDIQANKQINYFHILRNVGAWGNENFDINTCIVKDGKMYVFRNMKIIQFHEKHGYFSEDEKQKAEEQEAIYNAFRTAGIEVIECVFV